jgi:AbrB family looped-hinge helix DNA binding protein
MVEIVRISSKGQLVIPQHIREKMKIEKGESFAVFAKQDILILKKIQTPSAEDMFAEIRKAALPAIKKKGIKEEDVVRLIHEGRGVKYD